MSIVTRFSTFVLVASTVLAPTQCGHGDHTALPTGSAFSASGATWGADSLGTPIQQPNVCAFVSIYDVSRLLGRVEWMRSVRSAHDTTYDDHGTACISVSYLRQKRPSADIFALEVITESALAFETGAATMNVAANNMLKLIGAKTADGAQHGVDGWDYLGAYPREMTGRIGHIAIHADWSNWGLPLSLDSVEKLMTIVRDSIPDVPFRAIGPGSKANGDPCSLLTRDEAESVLGKLTARPYESRELSPLGDKDGTGCSYYTKNHHVLSIRPWWSNGKAVFNVSALTNKVDTGVLDRYTGEWDKVGANAIDALYFLKDDRLLAVSWRMSSTDEAGSAKLASIAMKKLLSQ